MQIIVRSVVLVVGIIIGPILHVASAQGRSDHKRDFAQKDGEEKWRKFYEDEVYRDELKVEAVSINNRTVSADEIRFLNRFPKLETLRIGDAPEGVEISTQSLSLVGKLSTLKSLHLCKAGLSDADLEFLPQLRNLRDLYIQGSDMIDPSKPHGMTDRATLIITKLGGLESLIITGESELSDAFVTEVLKLPKLRTFQLASQSVTNASLTHVSKSSFIRVRLASPRFTEDGLPVLLGAATLADSEVETRKWKFRFTNLRKRSEEGQSEKR